MLNNSRFIIVLWTALIALSSIGILLVMPYSLVTSAPLNLNQLSCNVIKPIGDQTFRIYTPSDWQANELTTFFCESVLIGSDYAHVELSWKPRENISSDDILSQQFDMLFSRPRVLNGLLPDHETFYQQGLILPPYTVYLYAHIPINRLSAATLYKRNIGLLDDKRSQSGFLIPEVELRKRGVTLDNTNTHWFHHRNDLINAFTSKSVDFIPAIGIEPELTGWPEGQRIELKTIPSAGSWYISNAVPNSIKCAASVSLLTKMRQSKPMHQLLDNTHINIDNCTQ
ncbi:hypothetical protein [Vibrio sp. CB1-14]|uniref:Solute-binding protein family 3/N-terminal domain-containing protein n=1 Tax=Vibrio chaetopteri TaxID=3016528 RepID=A0AAU8BM74_9VIBR